MKRREGKGILFDCRKGTSDEKTFDEVIMRNVYEKKNFKINKGEHWVDLGGNVGAFTLLACSKGAKVDVYEPDPLNCKQLEHNLKLNDFDANIHQKAVVANELKSMVMYVGNNLQTWRNSLYKNWGNQKFKVGCVHYSEVIKNENCIKMDIEGAEMPILESMEQVPKKIVFEWSFDIDPSYNRYRNVIDKFKKNYKEMYYTKGFYESPDDVMKGIFPMCDNIYCL